MRQGESSVGPALCVQFAVCLIGAVLLAVLGAPGVSGAPNALSFLMDSVIYSSGPMALLAIWLGDLFGLVPFLISVGAGQVLVAIAGMSVARWSRVASVVVIGFLWLAGLVVVRVMIIAP